jgi:hypothetical protein
MSVNKVSWDRLVRYVPEGKATEVHYGEPVLPDGSSVEDIGELVDQPKLQVNVFEGSDPFSVVPTDRTETVKKLLGPLESHNVPIIRCIGLNYKSHSELIHHTKLDI